MTLFIVSAVVSLVVVAVMAAAYRATKEAGYYYPAPLAALGVVLLFRTVIGKFVHYGYFLYRPLTPAATGVLWTLFVILVVLVLVRELAYDRLSSRLRGGTVWKGVIRTLGMVLLFWAIFSPFSWISPLWVAVLIVGGLVFAIVYGSKAIRQKSWTKGVSALIVLIFALVAYASTSDTFWTKDVPADAGKQFCDISRNHPAEYCEYGPQGSSGQGKGGEPGPQAHPSTIKYVQVFHPHGKNRVHNTAQITALCSSKDVCDANLRQNRLFAQSYANRNNAEVTLTPKVGNDTVGGVITTAPTGLADINYGAMAGDPCSLGPIQDPGVQKVNASTHELVCTVS